MIKLSYINAVIFATKKHKGQKSKHTDEDYIIHLLRVSQIIQSLAYQKQKTEKILLNLFKIDELMTASVLHDIFNTDTTEEEIKNNFGDKVLSIIKETMIDETISRRLGFKEFLKSLNYVSIEASIVILSYAIENFRYYKNMNEHCRKKIMNETKHILLSLKNKCPYLENKLLYMVLEKNHI